MAASPSPATSATCDAPGTYTLRLLANDGANTTIADVVVSVANNPASGGYSGWIADHPGVSSLTAPTDNPDADGHANLLEYALGGDPWDRSDQTDLTDHRTPGQPYTHTDDITPGARRILHQAPAAFCGCGSPSPKINLYL